MGFSVSSKIKLNIPVVKQLDKAKQQALEQTGDALLTQVKNTQVMPFDTDNLQNENTFVDYAQSRNGVVKIVSSTPYARRLYFHPEYNFHREVWTDSEGKNTVRTKVQAVNGFDIGSKVEQGRIFAVKHSLKYIGEIQDFDLLIGHQRLAQKRYLSRALLHRQA